MSGLEGLGVGANVVGVFVFGLQATKFIIDTISKYKEAEEEYDRFLNMVQGLAQALTEVNEIFRSDDDKIRYSRLFGATKRCEADLIEFNETLRGWADSNKPPKLKIWRKFKMCFLENNSKSYQSKLKMHYDFIMIHLNMMHRGERNDRKEERTTSQRTEVEIKKVSQSISSILDVQNQTLHQIRTTETSVTNEMQKTSKNIQDLNDRFDGNLQQINVSVNSMESTVNQFATMQLYPLAQEREEDEITKATGRISTLSTAAVTRGEAILRADQTEEILEDFGKLLNFAKKGKFSEVASLKHRKARLDNTNSALKARKLVSLLSNSDILAIGNNNQAVQRFRSDNSQVLEANIWCWQQKNFTLRISEIVKQNTDSAQPPQRVAKITYLPKVTGYGSIIDLYLAQIELPTPHIYTGLSFRTVVPIDSGIIEAILRGSVDKVRYLVGTRQANVNDCDKWGKSLLMCALMPPRIAFPDDIDYNYKEIQNLARNRLEISEFLIANGADVNHVDDGGCDVFTSTRVQGNPDGLKILIERGANLFVRPENFWQYTEDNNRENLRLLLDKVIEYFDINDSGHPQKLSMLHLYIWSYALGEVWDAYSNDLKTDSDVDDHEPPFRKDLSDIEQIVNMLVASGADPLSKCMEGETCLHLAINAARSPDAKPFLPGLAKLRDFLLFLIGDIGCDIRAKTNNGISVSDVAISTKDPAGRCIWPAWVEVLLRLGYDPLEVAADGICFGDVEYLLKSAPSSYCPCGQCEKFPEIPILTEGLQDVVILASYEFEFCFKNRSPWISRDQEERDLMDALAFFENLNVASDMVITEEESDSWASLWQPIQDSSVHCAANNE
ncbi:hypothetical protein H072_1062 [Dactylellina haptotyla CBS 200.50]|uniref:t-SNARE coiled-coil homology domain-containing protein n=1 Tax=Dactylellina haptotyla (strain CBS 200.50) TaxID=1284197 RepID=S8AQ22_DACHA|nr:hypothetical protein H072_1062 [Dactylellina haptotyla CBS 200.50]